MTDEEVGRLQRGGHSSRQGVRGLPTRHDSTNDGRPTVVLAHTVKGWMPRRGLRGLNVTHQKKKMDQNELKAFRDVLELPVTDDQLEKLPPFYHPGMKSPEVEYVLERRRALGGFLPKRRAQVDVKLEIRAAKYSTSSSSGMAKGEASTTMVFSRLSPSCCATRSASASYRSCRTRPAPSVWTRCSARSASTRRGPALRAHRQGQAALLPRSQGRSGARRGHHRGRLDGFVHRRRHVLRDARPSR